MDDNQEPVDLGARAQDILDSISGALAKIAGLEIPHADAALVIGMHQRDATIALGYAVLAVADAIKSRDSSTQNTMSRGDLHDMPVSTVLRGDREWSENLLGSEPPVGSFVRVCLDGDSPAFTTWYHAAADTWETSGRREREGSRTWAELCRRVGSVGKIEYVATDSAPDDSSTPPT